MDQTYLLKKLKTLQKTLQTSIALAEVGGRGNITLAAVPALLSGSKDVLSAVNSFIEELEPEIRIMDAEVSTGESGGVQRDEEAGERREAEEHASPEREAGCGNSVSE